MKRRENWGGANRGGGAVGIRGLPLSSDFARHSSGNSQGQSYPRREQPVLVGSPIMVKSIGGALFDVDGYST